MRTWARIDAEIVVEIIKLPDDVLLDEAFPRDFADLLVEVDQPNVDQGWVYDGTIFTAPSANAGAFRLDLKRLVDEVAEVERLKYITPGAGQAMTYQQKVTEAQGFNVATNPQPEDFPMLSSEVGITAPTLDEVADNILAAYGQWQLIGAAIEAIRLGAKRDIDAAGDEAAARAVVDAIEWPQPAL